MLRFVSRLATLALTLAPLTAAHADALRPATGWRQPPPEVMEVLHAPQLPWDFSSPSMPAARAQSSCRLAPCARKPCRTPPASK
jgi:hypothetical protein